MFKKIPAILLFLQIIIYSNNNWGAISGYVHSSPDGSPLYPAQVTVMNNSFGTNTSENGKYTLDLPPGEYLIIAQMIGYKNDTIKVSIKSDQALQHNFFLTKEAIKFPYIEVFSEGEEYNYSAIAQKLDFNNLITAPPLVEKDILQISKSLPGVTQLSDAGLLYIRGSKYDQNRISFDNVPLFNPYHLGSFTSFVNSYSIKEVEFSPVINSASNGGCLGGQINIRPKYSSPNSANTKISLGILSSRFNNNGKLKNTQYNLAGRMFYWDKLSYLISGEKKDLPYKFYDIQAGLLHPLNKRNQITLNMLFTRDILDYFRENEENQNIRPPVWGNQLWSVKLFNKLTDQLFLRTHAYYTDQIVTTDNPEYIVDNKMKMVGVQEECIFSTGLHKIANGIEFVNFTNNYFWEFYDITALNGLVGNVRNLFFDKAPSEYNNSSSTYYLNYYLQDEFSLNEKIDILSGIRFTYYFPTNKFFSEPKLNLKYLYNENVNIMFSLGKNNQYKYILKKPNSRDPYAPVGVYFPVKNNPLSSRFINAGIKISNDHIIFNIEGYLKDYNNVPIVDDLNRQITQKQFARGIDFHIKYSYRKLVTNLNYSLAKVNINSSGKDYPANYDRRHSLKTNINYNLKGINFNLFGMYFSGLPYTPVIGKYFDGFEHIWEIVVGYKNSKNYSPYYRLDMSIMKKWNYTKSELKLVLYFYNIFNQYNVLNENYEFYNHKFHIQERYNLPFLPGFEIEYIF